MTQYITRTDLKKYLNVMAILDVVMTSKKQAWLRRVNVSSIGKANAFVIDNGSGDNLVVIFTENGTLIKGFDHESKYNQFAADEWDDAFFNTHFPISQRNLPSCWTRTAGTTRRSVCGVWTILICGFRTSRK